MKKVSSSNVHVTVSGSISDNSKFFRPFFELIRSEIDFTYLRSISL